MKRAIKYTINEMELSQESEKNTCLKIGHNASTFLFPS